MKYELSMAVLASYESRGLPLSALLRRIKEGGQALDEIMDRQLLPKAGDIAAALGAWKQDFPMTSWMN